MIRIEVDDGASPEAIDYNASGEGQPRVGICEIEGDTLRIRGKERPKEMKPDETTVLDTFRWVKE